MPYQSFHIVSCAIASGGLYMGQVSIQIWGANGSVQDAI
jgi:hypothetical protein